MKLLQEYFKLQREIYEYFGYVEDWVVIPLNDHTEYYWQLDEDSDGQGTVKFSEEKDKILNDDGEHYEYSIYTQRFLPKWVYRGEEYTMICSNTHVDGNKFLAVFDNSKEI